MPHLTPKPSLHCPQPHYFMLATMLAAKLREPTSRYGTANLPYLSTSSCRLELPRLVVCCIKGISNDTNFSLTICVQCQSEQLDHRGVCEETRLDTKQHAHMRTLCVHTVQNCTKLSRIVQNCGAACHTQCTIFSASAMVTSPCQT